MVQRLKKHGNLELKGENNYRGNVVISCLEKMIKMSFNNELTRKLIPKQILVGSENFSKLLKY